MRLGATKFIWIMLPRLVLVDIPGVNEAGRNKVYMDYATENWDSFDFVVFVLDARQGANTDGQVNLAFEASQ
jgi:GTPase Era involved in 16S rRNA processing